MQDGNSRTPQGPVESDDPVEVVDDEARRAARADEQRDGSGSEPGTVDVVVHADHTVIVLSGEIDADLAADLQEATVDAEGTGLPIEVDTERVTFMDSSGIAFLARIATRSPHPVRVTRAPETVRFLLEVTRIGELLEVVEDEEPQPAHGLRTIGLADTSRRPPEPDGVA